MIKYIQWQEKNLFLLLILKVVYLGWDTSIYISHIAAIVAIDLGFGPSVGSNGYNALVSNKIPIVFYYGDYIGGSYNGNIPASSMWDGMRETAYTFKTSYESAGLTCTFITFLMKGFMEMII